MLFAHPSHHWSFSFVLQLGGILLEQEKNAQTEANKKWQEKNREKAKYLRNRSTSRSFIKNQATLADIEELQQLIQTRIELLTSASEQTE